VYYRHKPLQKFNSKAYPSALDQIHPILIALLKT